MSNKEKVILTEQRKEKDDSTWEHSTKNVNFINRR